MREYHSDSPLSQTAARKLALSWAIVLICNIWSIIMNFDDIDLDLIEIVEDLFSSSYVIIYQGDSYKG